MRYFFKSLANVIRTLRLDTPLDGITFGHWMKLIATYGYPSLRQQDLLRVTLVSIKNSILRIREQFQYSKKIHAENVHPPIFVLGFWRSGTTHLHQMLAVDKRYAYARHFDVNHPHTFLTTSQPEITNMRRRSQDSLTFNDSSPDEDEYALIALTRVTPDLMLYFPNQYDGLCRYLSFRQASAKEIKEFKDALLYFFKKLTLKYKRPLVLKSPAHTARIKILLELFPTAKFVHVHRDPRTVFQSNVNLYNTMLPKDFSSDDRDELIIENYIECYRSFFEQRNLIPKNNFVEISFDELDKKPIETMRKIYTALDLSEFQVVEPALSTYIDSLSNYKKNTYPALSTELQERLSRSWKEFYSRWGYNIIVKKTNKTSDR